MNVVIILCVLIMAQLLIIQRVKKGSWLSVLVGFLFCLLMCALVSIDWGENLKVIIVHGN